MSTHIECHHYILGLHINQTGTLFKGPTIFVIIFQIVLSLRLQTDVVSCVLSLTNSPRF